MKRTGTFSLLALCAAALASITSVPSRAAENGIRWGDCIASGTKNLSPTCSQGVATLVVSVDPPPGADHVVGFNADIALSVGYETVPPFWELWTGGCRAGAATVDFDFTSGPFTCTDPWTGDATGTIEIIPPPFLSINTLGIHIQGSLPGREVALQSGVEYYLFKIRIPIGDAIACPGCQMPACFVLEKLCLEQAPGSGLICQGYHEVGTPWCLWQDPDEQYSGCMLPVPTAPRSWGSVKTIYR
jgi:hypothetical protein